MTFPTYGTVRKGVAVPDAPLPAGIQVKIHPTSDALEMPPISKRNYAPGGGRAPILWRWRSRLRLTRPSRSAISSQSACSSSARAMAAVSPRPRTESGAAFAGCCTLSQARRFFFYQACTKGGDAWQKAVAVAHRMGRRKQTGRPTVLPRPCSGKTGRQGWRVSREACPGTDRPFSRPILSAAWQPIACMTIGPWLCAPVSRRVCPFEDATRQTR